MGGQDYNGQFRHLLLDFPRRFDAILDGHRYVHDDYVGFRSLGGVNRFGSIMRVAANFKARMGSQKLAYARPNDWMVLCHENSQASVRRYCLFWRKSGIRHQEMVLTLMWKRPYSAESIRR